WLESGSSNNVRIENNIIKRCRSIAVAVYAFGGARNVAPAGAHNNISITGNTITDCPPPNILVTSTTDLKIEGNVCEPSKTLKLESWKLREFRLKPEALEPVMTVGCEGCEIGRNKTR
ncbi:MAG: hypothetical protein ACYTFI_12425, partial [Planctomycetota bacterium]